MPYDIIVAGQLCLDMHPDLHQLPRDALAAAGKLWEIGGLTLSTGGAVGNTGVALHKLGAHVGLMANVGDDFVGQAILNIIRQHNASLIETLHIQPDTAGAYTVVLAPEQADRTFLSYLGTNSTFDSAALDFDVIAQTPLFHLGYPTLLARLYADNGAELAAIYAQAKRSGAVTSLDTTLPDAHSAAGHADWRAILQRVLPDVDIFVPSIEEAVFMLRRADYDAWQGQVLPHLQHAYLRDLAAEILAMGAAITGFKLGEYGLTLYASPAPARLHALALRLPFHVDAWRGVALYHPAFSVRVVGTAGAGDACYAGLLAALSWGYTPDAAIEFACAVGACNVEAADATSGILPRAATDARIRAGWAHHTARLPD